MKSGVKALVIEDRLVKFINDCKSQRGRGCSKFKNVECTLFYKSPIEGVLAIMNGCGKHYVPVKVSKKSVCCQLKEHTVQNSGLTELQLICKLLAIHKVFVRCPKLDARKDAFIEFLGRMEKALGLKQESITKSGLLYQAVKKCCLALLLIPTKFISEALAALNMQEDGEDEALQKLRYVTDLIGRNLHRVEKDLSDAKTELQREREEHANVNTQYASERVRKQAEYNTQLSQLQDEATRLQTELARQEGVNLILLQDISTLNDTLQTLDAQIRADSAKHRESLAEHFAKSEMALEEQSAKYEKGVDNLHRQFTIDMQKAKRAAQQQLEIEINKVKGDKEKTEDQIRKLEEEHKEVIERISAEAERRFQEFKLQKEKEVSLLKNAYEFQSEKEFFEVSSLKRENAALKTKFANLEAHYGAQIQSIHQDHQTRIQSITSRHEAEKTGATQVLLNAKKEFEEVLRQSELRRRQDVASLEQRVVAQTSISATEIKELENHLDDLVNDRRQEEKLLAALQAKLQTKTAFSEFLREQLKENHSQGASQIESLRKEISELESSQRQGITLLHSLSAELRVTSRDFETILKDKKELEEYSTETRARSRRVIGDLTRENLRMQMQIERYRAALNSHVSRASEIQLTIEGVKRVALLIKAASDGAVLHSREISTMQDAYDAVQPYEGDGYRKLDELEGLLSRTKKQLSALLEQLPEAAVSAARDVLEARRTAEAARTLENNAEHTENRVASQEVKASFEFELVLPKVETLLKEKDLLGLRQYTNHFSFSGDLALAYAEALERIESNTTKVALFAGEHYQRTVAHAYVDLLCASTVKNWQTSIAAMKHANEFSRAMRAIVHDPSSQDAKQILTRLIDLIPPPNLIDTRQEGIDGRLGEIQGEIENAQNNALRTQLKFLISRKSVSFEHVQDGYTHAATLRLSLQKLVHKVTDFTRDGSALQQASVRSLANQFATATTTAKILERVAVQEARDTSTEAQAELARRFQAQEPATFVGAVDLVKHHDQTVGKMRDVSDELKQELKRLLTKTPKKGGGEEPNIIASVVASVDKLVAHAEQNGHYAFKLRTLLETQAASVAFGAQQQNVYKLLEETNNLQELNDKTVLQYRNREVLSTIPEEEEPKLKRRKQPKQQPRDIDETFRAQMDWITKEENPILASLEQMPEARAQQMRWYTLQEQEIDKMEEVDMEEVDIEDAARRQRKATSLDRLNYGAPGLGDGARSTKSTGGFLKHSATQFAKGVAGGLKSITVPNSLRVMPTKTIPAIHPQQQLPTAITTSKDDWHHLHLQGGGSWQPPYLQNVPISSHALLK